MTRRGKSSVQVGLWGLSILVIIAVGLTFLPREYPGLSFWEALYTTLRLFVFERDLDPFPRSIPLIVIYFAAPLVTLSAVGTVLSYLVRLSPTFKIRWMRDHVIVCGVGRTGKLLAASLKARKINVVGIDKGPPEGFDEWCAHARIPIIFGDFQVREFLMKARAPKARSIIFAAGDDLENLEGGMSAYGWLQTDKGPIRLIWVHIAEERLAETARLALRTRGRLGIRFFDTYRIAAKRVIAKHFDRERRRGLAEISILGFGKFGRDLLEMLVRDMDRTEEAWIRVIDMADRAAEVRTLADELGVTQRVSFTQSAIQSLTLDGTPDKAYLLCTDDDLGNLTTAMRLSARASCSRIYVRMTHWPLPAVTVHLGEDRGITFVNINTLVEQEIKNLPGIFSPAVEADLKRHDITQA